MGATECEHNLLVPNQVHGDHIVTVTSNGADDLEAVREQIAEGCDAIVCTAHDVPVLLCFADCVPVVLVAPGGFAVVHSGWKGTTVFNVIQLADCLLFHEALLSDELSDALLSLELSELLSELLLSPELLPEAVVLLLLLKNEATKS